jgi:hypothetical protein
MNDGNHMVNPGISNTSIKPETMVPTIRKISGKVSSMLMPIMRVDVNRQTANGGVVPPMAKFNIMITPK